MKKKSIIPMALIRKTFFELIIFYSYSVPINLQVQI